MGMSTWSNEFYEQRLARSQPGTLGVPVPARREPDPVPARREPEVTTISLPTRMRIAEWSRTLNLLEQQFTEGERAEVLKRAQSLITWMSEFDKGPAPNHPTDSREVQRLLKHAQDLVRRTTPTAWDRVLNSDDE